MILDIVQLGDPILRRKAHKISKVDNEIRILANDMLETMRDSFGVGLAAPQIGELIRLIVVENYEDEAAEGAAKKVYKLINPEIVWRSEETVLAEEGCLSIKGLVGQVERAQSVRIKALSIYGRPMNLSASGWLARIFQHEIDHLDGICYVDRATEVREINQEETEDEEAAPSDKSPESETPV